MKSLIEEASSVSKAIEKVWIRAGKPTTFSIKIYEEPEKNFFGLTTKSAKVGIIFDEKTKTAHPDKAAATQPSSSHKHDKRPQTQKSKNTPLRTPTKAKERDLTTPRNSSAESTRNQAEPLISEDMKLMISTWIKETLQHMQLPDISFTADTSDQLVRVVFDAPLLADAHREKMVLRSMSYLLMAALRNRFKKNLRGLKIIFISA